MSTLEDQAEAAADAYCGKHYDFLDSIERSAHHHFVKGYLAGAGHRMTPADGGAAGVSVFHGEPSFWSGAYGTKPSPAPVYGRALDSNGDVLHLDTEVLARYSSHGLPPIRAKVVAIGDEGLPDRNICRVRPHGSAVLSGYSTTDCTPHHFDEYAWLVAETTAAAVMDKRGVDLARCRFGGFYFEQYQREVMKAYLAARGAK